MSGMRKFWLCALAMLLLTVAGAAHFLTETLGQSVVGSLALAMLGNGAEHFFKGRASK